MKYFTKAQIEEIRRQLATRGVKDTDLESAKPITGAEKVAIVQDGKNRLAEITNFFDMETIKEIIETIQRGESAYEIARRNGYEGSEEEWLASLKGAKGDKGDAGSGGGHKTIALCMHSYPNYDRSDDLYYFDDEAQFSEVPSIGDVIWYFGEMGYLYAWEVVNIVHHENPGTDPWDGVVARMILDEMDLFPIPVDNLNSTDSKAPLSANQGRILKEMIENGEGGGGGGQGGGGSDGRSIVSVQMWYKLAVDESVSTPAMSVADPTTVGWSLTSSSPTAQYPYLRCFMQVNYDKPIDGYMYTRSSAFTARYYNSDSSAEYQELEEAINDLRDEMMEDLREYDGSLDALNTALSGLRASIEVNVLDQLDSLHDRFANIDQTEVKQIEDDGLWSVLTSYASDPDATDAQKSFADITLDAENAKATLETGATFFDRNVGVGLTLDSLVGEIEARATLQQVDSKIAQAQFSVDPSALTSVISKGQVCWKKENGDTLYRYDLYFDDFFTDNPTATLSDYEDYMESAPADGGPAADTTHNIPAGPFELSVTVDEFSVVKQTAEEVSSSIDKVKYVWQKNNDFKSYDAFEDEYEDRASRYESYSYEQYVQNVKGYTKKEFANSISNITQTSEEIKTQLGDVKYFWKKGNTYEVFAVPANTTRSAYISSMQSNGWTLITYASGMSTVDQKADSLTSLVKNSTLVWIDEDATGSAYQKDYDAWLDDYNLTDKSLTYEAYVLANHSTYELTVVTDSFSRIKQASDSITSAVESIDDHEERLSAVEITADEVSIAVSKSDKCWKDNGDGSVIGYEAYRDDYNTYKSQTQNPLDYDDWVANTQGCTLVDEFDELSGIKVKSDKVWMAVGDGDEVKASITILGESDVDEETGSKIILDADNVIINGGLSAGVVTAGAIAAGAVTADSIAANSITATKIKANAITADKINAGAVTADKIATDNLTAQKIFSNWGNIAGFIFNNGRMESESQDGEGAPNIVIDGNTGKFIANDAEIRGNIEAESGLIGGLAITENGLSGNYISPAANRYIYPGMMVQGHKFTNLFRVDRIGMSLTQKNGTNADDDQYGTGVFNVGDYTKAGFVDIAYTSTGSSTQYGLHATTALLDQAYVTNLDVTGKAIISGQSGYLALDVSGGTGARFTTPVKVDNYLYNRKKIYVASLDFGVSNINLGADTSGCSIVIDQTSKTITLPQDPEDGFFFEVVSAYDCTLYPKSGNPIKSVMDGNNGMSTYTSSFACRHGNTYKLMFVNRGTSSTKMWIVTKKY